MKGAAGGTLPVAQIRCGLVPEGLTHTGYPVRHNSTLKVVVGSALDVHVYNHLASSPRVLRVPSLALLEGDPALSHEVVLLRLSGLDQSRGVVLLPLLEGDLDQSLEKVLLRLSDLDQSRGVVHWQVVPVLQCLWLFLVLASQW